MPSFYDLYLQDPGTLGLISRMQADPSQLGYNFIGNDETGQPLYVNSAGEAFAGANWRPDNPYATNNPMDANLSLEQASSAGLFGSTDAGLARALSGLYGGAGKSDADLVHDAQSVLQSHYGKFGQGYTAASTWGAIDNDILSRGGINTNGFDFRTLPGYSEDAAAARGQADKNKNYSGDFGNNNFISNVGNYASNYIGDLGADFHQTGGILPHNNPAETAITNRVFGKDYDPNTDAWGGATSKEQQNMAAKGVETGPGALIQTGLEAFAGGSIGASGSQAGQTVSAINASNSFQNGGNANWNTLLPAAIKLGASYFSGGKTFDNSGNEISGGGGNNSLTGDLNGDYLNNTGNSSGGSMDGELFDPSYYDATGDTSFYQNGGYTQPDTGGGAFDQSGSQGVFDQYGNPTYNPYAGGGDGIGSSLMNYLKQAYGLYNDNKGMVGILGKLLQTGLGVAGSRQQQQGFQQQANQYADMGAPYRSRLAEMYANPASFYNSAQVQIPVQQSTDMLARALSVNGNPIGSGNALQQLQNYSANQLFGQFGNEANRLANFGGLSQFNAAAPGASSNAIMSGSNIYNALGAGANDIFNPTPSLAQTMADYKRLSQAIP